MPRRYPIYVVDDQDAVRAMLCALCADWGFTARAFDNGDAFLAAQDELQPGCVLLDMRMPVKGGLAVQEELAARGSPHAVIALSGHGFVDMAVESMKLGALDFIEKPFDPAVLREAVQRAFQALDARLGAGG